MTAEPRCNCPTFNSASLCPFHTQADYGAAEKHRMTADKTLTEEIARLIEDTKCACGDFHATNMILRRVIKHWNERLEAAAKERERKAAEAQRHHQSALAAALNIEASRIRALKEGQ